MIHLLRRDAGQRRADRLAFQLCGSGGAVRQNHPLRTIRHMVNEALLALADDFAALLADRATVDPAGEVVAGDASAGVLFDPFGTASDGAGWNTISCSAGLSASASMMRRGITRCFRRTGTGWRGEVLRRGADAAQSEKASLERSLLGRRHSH